jgi:hypothetical protein
MRILKILLLFVITGSYAQIRFKPAFDISAGTTRENFFVGNVGIAVEQKFFIDKSIETGLFHHAFSFVIKKDKFDFYNAFIKNTANDTHGDSLTHVAISFRFTTIPFGLNYYLTPRFYLTYKGGFNFFRRTQYSGLYSDGDASSENEVPLFEGERFDRKNFKKFYLNHSFSMNFKLMRRFEGGLVFIWTPKGQFMKKNIDPIFKNFNDEVSKYFAIGLQGKFYLFQIKSRDL